MAKMKNDQYPEEMFRGRRCRDWYCPTNAEIRDFFMKEGHRLHHRCHEVYRLADDVLVGLGHGDILDSDLIPLRDRNKFRIEVSQFIAKRLAIYLIKPQRYGNQARNILAVSLNFFTGRIFRFRMGWGLSKKPTRMVSKSQFGLLIDDLVEHEYLWSLAEKYVASYRWRLKHGYCEDL